MNPISKQFSSIEQVTGQYLKQKNVTSPSKTSDVSFEDVLRQQQQLKFSKHASQRLESRNISLSEEQNARLEDGVEQAHAKGIKDSSGFGGFACFYCECAKQNRCYRNGSDGNTIKYFYKYRWRSYYVTGPYGSYRNPD